MAQPDPVFRVHAIDPDNPNPAAAVLDVNGDGQLDLLSGGWWYQAPSWQRHFVRQVEVIRGRQDDYANLPLDVDGDGLLDIVSVNYRSESIYWTRNPGPAGGEWQKTVIARPGAAETGRLVDLDGDGRLDILPLGGRYVAWFRSVQSEPGQSEPRGTEFQQRDLPRELSGHGLGWGDINGDGRVDLVGVRGWAEAPEELSGRWRWHAEFQLMADASCPILVLDVDRDGDQDLVCGRGHDCGLYWLEQTAPVVDAAERGVARSWQLHAIDTSWTQAHTLAPGDLDGDGIPEVITGKRYLGHDGRDVGEYDPLVIYRYVWQPARRTWHRSVIAPAGSGGIDLDPVIQDVDGDGDVDVVGATRKGLVYCENLGAMANSPPPDAELKAGSTPIPSELLHDSIPPQDLSHWVNNQGQREPIGDLHAWAWRRQLGLNRMQLVMGELPGPDRRPPLDLQVHEEVSLEVYRRLRISFASDSGPRVTAYLLVPHELTRPAPAMLCLHPTTPLGKDIVANLGGTPHRQYAHELASRGFVCLAPDYPSFGEATGYDFEADRFSSGTMKAIWDNHRGVDLLVSLPEVDPDRIGAIGHSLGGHNALFTAAFDQRLRAVVTSCGFTGFHDYYQGRLAGWTSSRYMPAIAERYGNDPDRVPFDFQEVLGALAPRHVFVSAPLHDSNFDNQGVRKVLSEVSEVYQRFGFPDRLVVRYPDCEHDFPDEVRAEVYQWLKEVLY